MSGIHILPFYPYTSDDGFSVSNFHQVFEDYGDWCDITRLGKNYRLMFDAVINHSSVKHAWFQGFLQSQPPFDNYYITENPDTDLSTVVRPRTLPLLTPFETASGIKHVWTTFSADQVDLNYANPQVLLEIVDLLLFYTGYGAEFIRLDAIAYLWKEPETTCIHLHQTHRIIQLFRTIFDFIAPHVSLITETNVPHNENVSYFGDGTNEARMVYNFALPPLTLHAIQTGKADKLTEWAQSIHLPSQEVTFFNFLASHDGIGLNPARGILSQDEIDNLVSRVERLDGRVNYKHNSDGSSSPYELNINYYDALGDPGKSIDENTHIKRFILSQAMMLSLIGIPGIYVHSLLGSRGWTTGISINGHNRAINREKLSADMILAELSDPNHRRTKIWRAYRHLLTVRRNQVAFHPFGDQEILELNELIFAVLRKSESTGQKILCLHNLSEMPIKQPLPPGSWNNLLMGARKYNHSTIQLEPYEVCWLEHGG